MKRRSFLGAALAGMPITGIYAKPPKVKTGGIPTTTFGKTGVKVSVLAQGGARMDLQPDVQSAAAHIRRVYDLGLTYFDCARSYWNGRSEEAYGIGLQGVRKNVFLTTKTMMRTAKEAKQELETSLRLLKTDYVDLWQVHNVLNQDDIDKILSPGGAMVDTNATGQANFWVIDDGTAVRYRVNIAGIENLRMAHIHVAPAPVFSITGPAGPVAFWFVPTNAPPAGSTIQDRFQGNVASGVILTDTQLVGPVSPDPTDPENTGIQGLIIAMREGRASVVVRTEAMGDPNFPLGGAGNSPTGEIRGTILPAD